MLNVLVSVLSLLMLWTGGTYVQNELFKIFETAYLQIEFSKRVGGSFEIELDYREKILQDSLSKLLTEGVKESQYFLYVDRNPGRQLIFIFLFDAENEKVVEIGRDKVSTGKPDKGRDYFLTPTGIFRNTVQICGYRALGTKNSRGWRGLGKKGSRVWDFGWQEGYRRIDANPRSMIHIRFLLHATDPDFGESRLGQPDSKGCVRISGKLNEFLDFFGLIDSDYEKQNHWLLRKNRKPVLYQGEYLIVGDSAVGAILK